MKSDALLELVRDDKRCDKLIKALDDIARDHDQYEYGLPLWNDAVLLQMRETIYRWVAEELKL